jgi:hypothetical protein
MPHKPHVFGIQTKPCGCREGIQMIDNIRRWALVGRCDEHQREELLRLAGQAEAREHEAQRQKAARQGKARPEGG